MRGASLIGVVAVSAAALVAVCEAAGAEPFRPAAYDWEGFYFGAHVGYNRGAVDVTLSDPAPPFSRNGFGALYGGIQTGYNHRINSRWLVGVELDATYPNYLGADHVVWSRTTPGNDVTERLDYVGTLRGRVGTFVDHRLIYATGGFAWAQSRFLQTPGIADDHDKVLRFRTGWAAGGGVEAPITPEWTLRAEYIYSRFGNIDVVFPSGAHSQSAFDLHAWRLGLNRRLGAPRLKLGQGDDATGGDNWELHGQATYIVQGYGRFRSSYIGENSFTPWPQVRNTTTATAFLGFRAWRDGEIYFAPELLQGFGLHDTTGAGGYPNGEAQKSNFAYPHYHTSRLFVRQTFGFGGEQETLESAANQVGKKVDVSRLTIQVGKFPVADVFDGNSYARDPRKDFMNWSIWAAGAFDYAADKVGLAWGAVADFNQKHWALRAGYFLMPSQSNGNMFDMRLGERGSYVLELETRHTLFGRPGKLRTIGFVNSDFSGSYRETLDNPALMLEIARTRRGRIKYGYAFNVEQAVADDVGVFGRWSWNDGRNEIMAFTDIDSSLSGGVSIKGKSWGRPEDVFAVGGAINALSKDHRDFLAAGGITVLVGDGRLNYATEKVLETYYTWAVNKATSLTFDYQLLVNPAYNADRGPISIYAARVHAEF